MTVPEAIELFHKEMVNEINHNVSDTTLHATLIDAVKDVASNVYGTYIADKDGE